MSYGSPETRYPPWTRANGAINGWPAIAQDTIIFPIGLTEDPLQPHLLALRLDG